MEGPIGQTLKNVSLVNNELLEKVHSIF